MDWQQLLSSKRLGKTRPEPITPGRSPFQQDFDRIVFSSAFRRLQDKAQVFPLADNDYVRTRLTHSMEVSCIGRSMGSGVGAFICREYDLGDIQPSDVGAIVAAACLAHDIGNPPLGHSGEEAIRHWFATSEVARVIAAGMTPAECSDIENYEGNAQGFRILARLQMPDNPGGMQLTCATLGSFAKYPVGSPEIRKIEGVGAKKFNFFQADNKLFAEVAETTGLTPVEGRQYAWHRHPLVFLVEAADDISYQIVDFEDGHMLGIIPYPELEAVMLEIIGTESRSATQLQKLDDPERKVEFLRAKALGTLVGQIITGFVEHHQQILAGELKQPLTELIPAAPALAKISRRSVKDIYNYRRAVEIEAAGFELTEGLLDAFMSAANEVASNHPSYRSQKLIQLLPERYRNEKSSAWRENNYTRLLHILDYISGMTDSYAVSLFKKIKGISLPGVMR